MTDASPIPSSRPDDDDDVSFALDTAATLWARGEHHDALKWLRRASDSASDADHDMRSIELAKAAGEVSARIGPSHSTPAPAAVVSTIPQAVPQRTPPPPPVRPTREPPPRQPSTVPAAKPNATRPPPPVPATRNSSAPISQRRGTDFITTPRPVQVGQRASSVPAPPATPPMDAGPTSADGKGRRRTETRSGARRTEAQRRSSPDRNSASRLTTNQRGSSAGRGSESGARGSESGARGSESGANPPPKREVHATLPRFEDERTVERDFSALVKSGTFDSLDENTSVLSGDEADLAILNEARPRAAAVLETLPTPTGMRSPASTAPAAELSEHTPLEGSTTMRPASQAPPEGVVGGAVLAYHVAVVNDGDRVELLWLSPTESAARDLPTAMLVPIDAAAAESIAEMLKRARK